MKTLTLQLQGPYNNITDENSIFDEPQGSLKGVYFHTIQWGNKYLVSYIGETVRDLKKDS